MFFLFKNPIFLDENIDLTEKHLSTWGSFYFANKTYTSIYRHHPRLFQTYEVIFLSDKRIEIRKSQENSKELHLKIQPTSNHSTIFRET